MASGSADNTVKLWDVEHKADLYTIQNGITEMPNDIQWNLDGSLLACCFQKDKKIRMYDPRQKDDAIFEFEANNGVKGTFLSFMEGSRVMTVGFNKSVGGKPGRTMSIWELNSPESLHTPVASKIVAENNFSSVMIPYYDPATGIAYLTGRGNSIFFYEINNTGEMIYPVGNSTTSISYTGAVPVPKRLCDVKTCEIERFYMVSPDTVAITSVICPRKSSQTIFQEDLYPAVPGPQPSLDIQSWRDGKNARANMISLKPHDQKSIFELSKEEGGKSKVEEIQRQRTRTASKALLDTKAMASLKKPEITEGLVKVYTNGWFRKWGDRWIEINKDFFYVYEKQDSPNLTLAIPIDSITKVDKSSEYEIKSGNLFVIESNSLSEPEHFYCSSAELCIKWIKSIQLLIDQSTQIEGNEEPIFIDHQSSPTKSSLLKSSSLSSNNDTTTTGDNDNIMMNDACLIEGWLEMYLLGYIYNGWVSRYFFLTKDTLFVYKNDRIKTTNPLEILHIPKMITVSKSDESHPNRAFTFKLCTATRVIHLASKEEEQMNQWIEQLINLIHPDNPLLNKKLISDEENKEENNNNANNNEDKNESESTSSVIEGYVLKKNFGLISGFTKPFTKYFLTVAAGKDFLYFNNPRDTTTRFRISMSSVIDVKESSQFPELGFEVHTNDNKIHLHQCESVDDRDRWISALKNMKNQFINYFEHLSINSDTINVDSRVKDSKIENFIDPIEVKNGKYPLLIKVVGKRKIRTKLVPLTSKSLTETSVYILDHGMNIYQWSGKYAPRVVKAKGWDLTNKLRTKERGGLAKVIQLDQGKDNNNEFWEILGGKPPPKKLSDDYLNQLKDKQNEEDKNGDFIRIFRIGTKDIPLESQIKLIHEGYRPPPKEFLLYNSVSIVDCDSEIFIWIGKESTPYQRKLGLIVALKLQKQEERLKKYNNQIFLSRVFDKGETILFKEKFSNYPGMLPIHVGKQEKKSGFIASHQEQQNIDVMVEMHQNKNENPIEFHSDPDISGEIIKVWKIDGFERKELPKNLFGQFWENDSFVIVYRFPFNNKFKNLVYFWQGKCSSRNEKGTSAYMTVDVSDEIGSDVEQIRVVQDKEDEHFLRVMNKYNFIIHRGKYDSTTYDDESENENKQFSIPHLYSIAGTNQLLHPIEVPLSCFQLSTLHCYVLLTLNASFIWIGALANQFEIDRAHKLADSRSDIQKFIANESSNDFVPEFDVFWRLLGGKGKYYGHDGHVESRKPHRLFAFSNATGSVKVDEIFSFAQEDTIHYEHSFVFDIFHEVFVWIGKNATSQEKKITMESAIEYVVQSPFGHSPDTPIWVIYPYAEPLAFTINVCNYISLFYFIYFNSFCSFLLGLKKNILLLKDIIYLHKFLL